MKTREEEKEKKKNKSRMEGIRERDDVKRGRGKQDEIKKRRWRPGWRGERI